MTYEQAANILFQHINGEFGKKPNSEYVEQAKKYMEKNHGYTCGDGIIDGIPCPEQCTHCKNCEIWREE